MKHPGKIAGLASAATALAAVLAVSACSPKPSDEQVAASQASESAAMSITAAEAASQAVAGAMASVDATGYVGKWTGPEGTSLTVTPAGSAYEVIITNLDGPRTFTGTLEGDGIHIVRDAAPLVIHKGDGQATGMKWLAEKRDCLVVAANEGYCKD
jgi:hypothetical protein